MRDANVRRQISTRIGRFKNKEMRIVDTERVLELRRCLRSKHLQDIRLVLHLLLALDNLDGDLSMRM